LQIGCLMNIQLNDSKKDTPHDTIREAAWEKDNS